MATRPVGRRWLVVLLGPGATACTPPGLPDPIAPTGLTSVPSSPPAAGTVVIGLDGSAGRIAGFNPYAIADFSLASQAAASLVLPSAFVVAADGAVTADPDVIDAATVTSQDPFTVTYTVDRKASWSDGTPITAEDFSYLRDQLAGAARHRRPGRLSADQRDPFAGCRQDRRGGVQQAVPGLADAVLAVAAEPPDEGFPGRLGGRARPPTCRCPRTATG